MCPLPLDFPFAPLNGSSIHPVAHNTDIVVFQSWNCSTIHEDAEREELLVSTSKTLHMGDTHIPVNQINNRRKLLYFFFSQENQNTFGQKQKYPLQLKWYLPDITTI